MRTPTPAESLEARPTTFVVGAHTLVVSKLMEHRWKVSLDGRPIDASFDTQAEAWEAGVRAAHRADAASAH